ncbi:MAG: hypothetical protein P8Z37_02095 [Acidobacteriota bacterium]
MLHKTFDPSGFPHEIPGSLKAAANSLYGKHDRLWSIILAGGRGERIRPFVCRWRGHPIPKQYCAFVGTRSMLQQTLDRAITLGERDQQITVIDRLQQNDAVWQIADRARISVRPFCLSGDGFYVVDR